MKTGEEQEEEVRRFVIDKTLTFSTHWTDEDRDNVTITSEEELIIALTKMSGPGLNIKKTKPVVTGQEFLQFPLKISIKKIWISNVVVWGPKRAKI